MNLKSQIGQEREVQAAKCEYGAVTELSVRLMTCWCFLLVLFSDETIRPSVGRATTLGFQLDVVTDGKARWTPLRTVEGAKDRGMEHEIFRPHGSLRTPSAQPARSMHLESGRCECLAVR
jgi:hypothetical protein